MNKTKTEATKTEMTEREALRKEKAGLDVTLIDQWIAEHYEGPEDILGKEGLLAQLTKAVVERALTAELTHHLGYAQGGAPAGEGGNCRNGTSVKTLIGEGGKVEIAVPRDRLSTFEPRLIAKGQRRFEGFDGKIIAMYAGGMTAGDSGSPAGAVSGGRGPRLHQHGDRRGAGGGGGVAEPAVGTDVSDRVLRRAAGEDPQ